MPCHVFLARHGSDCYYVDMRNELSSAEISELQNFVGAKHVLVGDDLALKNMVWEKNEPCQGVAWLRPASTEELSSVLKWCNQHNQRICIAGGLTNLTFATRTQPDELVISLERMNKIEELSAVERTLTVQAGVLLQHAQQAAAEENLYFPWDIGARGSCTIGGNISTNAGGTKVIRYGMTRENILGLEAVLADGTIVSSMNRYLKNNSGYDLKQLFIGTEGALGIVTKAVVRLHPVPVSHNVALLAVNSYPDVLTLFAAANQTFSTTLSGFEVMWQEFYAGATAKDTHVARPISAEYKFYVLLETMGQDLEADQTQFESVLGQWFEDGLAVDGSIAQSDHQRNEIWEIRDNVGVFFKLPNYLVYDFSLPIAATGDFVESYRLKAQEIVCDVIVVAFGHLGDNNLHLKVSVSNDYGDDTQSLVRQVNELAYQELQAYGGAVAAEHGIGFEKKEFLINSRNQQEIDLMKTLKISLDPENILNPGRVFSL